MGMKHILVKRKSGELYQCKRCGAFYAHDQGYHHDTVDCPKPKGGRHE